MHRLCRLVLFVSTLTIVSFSQSEADDHVRELQQQAVKSGKADWGHWGPLPDKYSSWTNHSSRLIPVYTFGITLDKIRLAGNPYHDAEKLSKLYTRPLGIPADRTAEQFEQTNIYDLQLEAVAVGKKQIILLVFDGMDWQTTQAAAIYNSGLVGYHKGRGTGLAFLDYASTKTDFGFFATSPICAEPKVDVNAQQILGEIRQPAGYDARIGGRAPWLPAIRPEYLLGTDRESPAPVTDSAASATSLTSGIKTFNGSINVDVYGKVVTPIARKLQQEKKISVGIVTSVPISHATPGCAYSNNVSRDDFQDITRDMLGLPSVANRQPLPGADVVIGAGWGETKETDPEQGENFVRGNRYLTDEDRCRIDVKQGGKYEIAQRTSGVSGSGALQAAAKLAAGEGRRLLGFFGVVKGHLPYRTADGNFDPVEDVAQAEQYSPADITENPTLTDCTTAALTVLQENPLGFWLMVEAGDVDWANHSNNIDNSIGAVLSGNDAFKAIIRWVESRGTWADTAVIVTSDHGHYLNIVNLEVLAK